MSRRTQWAFALTLLVASAVVGSYVAGPLLRGQSPATAPAIPEPVSFRDVAKKILPAVVSIETKTKVAKAKPQAGRVRPNLPDNVPEEFRRFFEGMEQFEGQMPQNAPHHAFGSGFIVDPNGVVLTNHHVVAGADEVEVQLMDGRKFTSKDIKSDPKTDLAIVRIDAKNLPYLELGDSDAMEIGDRVLTAGAPFGLKGSMSAGIVSAKGRNGLNMNMYEDYIQTDAAINPGNSGGPLVNLQGKVVGINSMIKTESGGFQGVGLAVSSNMAKNVMTQLMKNGTVKRGYLGIQIRDIADPELASRLGVKDHGILVAQAFDKGPAAKAGIQPGDVITDIAGKPVKEGKDLQKLIAGLEVGKAINVTVLRDGKEKVLPVTIEEQPQEFGTVKLPKFGGPRRETNTTSLDQIGVEVTDLTPELAEQYGYPEGTKGVVVMKVEQGSLADEGGIRRGMLITKIEKQPVKSAAELKESLDKASIQKGVLFQIENPQTGVAYLMLKGEPQK